MKNFKKASLSLFILFTFIINVNAVTGVKDFKEDQATSKEVKSERGWFGRYDKSPALLEKHYQVNHLSATRMLGALLLTKVPRSPYTVTQDGLNNALYDSILQDDAKKVGILIRFGADHQEFLPHAIAHGSVNAVSRILNNGAILEPDHVKTLKECYANNALSGTQVCDQIGEFMKEALVDKKRVIEKKAEEKQQIIQENNKSHQELIASRDKAHEEIDKYYGEHATILTGANAQLKKEVQVKQKQVNELNGFCEEINKVSAQAQENLKNIFTR